MDEENESSANSALECPETRDVSDFSRDELLAHIGALEMEISGKDGIIQSLRGDLPVSTDHTTNMPVLYKRRLENTIVEQNLMIESLREELEHKHEEFQRLNEESFSLKDEARTEVERLKQEIERNEIRWKEENLSLGNVLEASKCSFEAEREDLLLKLQKEMDRNYFLEQQLALSSNRLEELRVRELDHDAEMNVIRSHWEAEVNKSNQLLRSCQPAIQASTLDDSSVYRTAESSSKAFESRREPTDHSGDVLALAQMKVEELTVVLKSFEIDNSRLKEACDEHQVALGKLKEELFADLDHVNRACTRLYEIIRCLSSSVSSFDDCDVTGDNLSSTVIPPEQMLNVLLDKIEKCSLEIEKYHEGVVELKNENERVSNENDALKEKVKEMEEAGKRSTREMSLRYEELLKKEERTVESLKIELDRSKADLSLFETKSNEDIERLKEDLNSVESRFKELKKNYDQLMFGSQHDESSKKDQIAALSPISKFGLPSELTPPKLILSTNFITSTPYPAHLKGAGEGLPLVSSVVEEPCQLSVIRWMETCQKLNYQNSALKNEVNDLKMVINRLETSASSIHNEMQLFDSRRKELDAKLSDYAEIKTNCCQLTNQLALNELKINELKQEVRCLEASNADLIKANANYQLHERRSLNVEQEDVLKDLNAKINEIAMLKSQICALSFTKRALHEKCDQLAESKNLCALRNEKLIAELNLCRGEIDKALRENGKLATSVQCLKNDNLTLRASLEEMNNHRKLNWGLLENQSLAEEMLNSVFAVCREAIEKKFEFEKVLSGGKSGGNTANETDARHRVELLMKDNGILIREKENLMRKIYELEKILHDVQKSQGDADLIFHLKSTQTNLMKEMSDQREQHARIEEAIRSTGKLHDELQKEKDDNKIKVVELAKLQKKYLEEKLKARQFEMDVELLRKELQVKKDFLKAVEKEKQRVQNELEGAKEKLVCTEEKLAFEVQCNQLKSKWAEIQNTKNEVMEQFSSVKEDTNLLLGQNFDYYKQIRQQIESNYTEALEAMKAHLTEEFAEKAHSDHISHLNQVNFE